MELFRGDDALRDGIFLAGPDRILVVKGYMDTLMTWYGGGTKVSTDDADMTIICYELKA